MTNQTDQATTKFLNFIDTLESDELTNTVANQTIDELRVELHENISQQSLELAKEIYSDWRLRETKESDQREHQLQWVKIALICQMIVATALFVVDFFISVNNAILIGLITAIIVEFLGLLSIMVRYMYSERSTKSLEVVAQIMGEVGNNNSTYSENKK